MEPEEILGDLNKTKPIIVLEHQPKQLEELEAAGADMQLCGHTHDGQMFPGNLTIKLMWENACGYLKKGNLHSIVTSGVGVWGPAMRVGTDCEICPITVHFPGITKQRDKKGYKEEMTAKKKKEEERRDFLETAVSDRTCSVLFFHVSAGNDLPGV